MIYLVNNTFNKQFYIIHTYHTGGLRVIFIKARETVFTVRLKKIAEAFVDVKFSEEIKQGISNIVSSSA